MFVADTVSPAGGSIVKGMKSKATKPAVPLTRGLTATSLEMFQTHSTVLVICLLSACLADTFRNKRNVQSTAWGNMKRHMICL